MARYIDADKYVEYLEKEICSKCIDDVCGACGLDSARWIAEEFPTADVVPKSEVTGEIFKEIDEILHYHGITIGLVFDEAEGAAMAIGRIDRKIAELKKKYTEGD